MVTRAHPRRSLSPAGQIKASLQVIAIVLSVLASMTALVWLLAPTSAVGAATLPPKFQETLVFGGLSTPTAVEFSDDGRVFVTEKSGKIKVFDDLSDPTPKLFADLRTKVYNRSDRGLLGLALDPGFPAKPYVYVSYAHDAPIGGVAPRWGQPGADSDDCPSPPGPTEDGCVISGRVSRLTVSASGTMSEEKVLVEDWCQQYPSHTVGDLAFGADGALYASGGDGAAWNFTDYGQRGIPRNPCGDPPTGVGGNQTTPTGEGGSLRSQDLRTAADPVGLSGTIVRLDPQTGAALPDNPLAARSDANARRIVAYGLRNPFRFAIRPGTNELWIGNVGASDQDEIEFVQNLKDSEVENFGWPCYNGASRFAPFDSANLNMCENLYSEPGAVTEPFYVHNRNQPVVVGESCPNDQITLSGLAFYEGGDYPPAYDGAMFFTDYGRNCIWTMFKGANGRPDKTNKATFVEAAATPVDLEIGPGGDLFYVNIGGRRSDDGEVRRIQYLGTNQRPNAVIEASPAEGAAPLEVTFDAGRSSDPEGDPLTYAWDLDDDGAYDDSSAPRTTWSYASEGNQTARLRVTDAQGATGTASKVITVGSAPDATIETPLATTTWKVGDQISFSGSASDPEEGQLPASALSWSAVMHHCPVPNNCHQHPIQDFPGVASGSFATLDHEYPSYIELKLTATDSTGLTNTKTLRLNPQAVEMDFRSDPTGLQLVVGDYVATAPFSRTVIVGSTNSVSATSPQSLVGQSYEFVSWSDSGAQSHDVVAGATRSTYTATYQRATSSSPSVEAPVQQLVLNRTLDGASAAPVKLAWSATDDGGISSYELQQSVDGGSFRTVERLSTSSTTAAVTSMLSHGKAHQFRVRARDVAGEWSDWATGPKFVVDLHQANATGVVEYSGRGWKSQKIASASAGSVRYATASGNKATLTFTGRNVAWVAPRGADRGKAEVWLDGVKVTTLNLYASAAQARRLVFTKDFGSSGRHTLEVRVLGTRDRPSRGTRADVDAFVVLR